MSARRMSDEEFEERRRQRGRDEPMVAEADRARESEAALVEALGPDLAGRDFADLLDAAAQALHAAGGGPIADCLASKATDVRAALLTATGESR